MAVYNDGDLGVYLHKSLKGWNHRTKLPTSGVGVVNMGRTLHWDEFAYLDTKGNPVEGYQSDRSKRGRIIFNESWDQIMADIHGMQVSHLPNEVASMSRNGQPFDIKERLDLSPYGHFTGRKATMIGVGEVFMSAKSIGNYMVGHYAGYMGVSLHDIMNLAGALQQKQWQGMGTAYDVFVNGKEYGPAPYYGETEYAGRMIELGRRCGLMERGLRMAR